MDAFVYIIHVCPRGFIHVCLYVCKYICRCMHVSRCASVYVHVISCVHSVSELYQPIDFFFFKDGALVMGSPLQKLQSCSWMRIDRGHT